MSSPSFESLRVLSFESRRAAEVAALIGTYGGRAVIAPALREVPLETNPAVMAFAASLLAGEIDMTVFLTGVGTRQLLTAAERIRPRAALIAALAHTKVVVRGPKPLAVLRELAVPVWAIAPEPNTWRELVAAIDARAETGSLDQSLAGRRVAVQEYGVSNPDLLEALRERGALVTPVHVYGWALPDDVAPLKNAIAAIGRQEIDVVLFTTGVQLVHLWQLVTEMRVEPQVREGLARAVIASIGPSTSEELQRHGLGVDLEASHPKFGLLIREMADRAADLLKVKRGREGA